MCGIVGIVASPGGALPDETIARAMTDAITHRGPDDDGIYRDDQAMLGMRRLSIIDLAGGHQPVHNEDGSVQAVCNGEIYNLPRAAPRARGAGTPLLHPLRHRGDRPRLRGVGRRRLHASRRHVRDRALGQALPRPCPGPRPLRRKAPLLQPPGGRDRCAAALRQRAQVTARRPWIQARNRPRGGSLLRLLRVRPHAGQHLPGRPQAAAWALAPLRRGAARAPPLLPPRARAQARLRRTRGRGTAGRPARRGGEEPPLLGRSVRRVPERGARLERGGRAHGASPADAGADVLARFPRVSLQRALRRTSRGESPRDRASRADRQTQRGRAPGAAGLVSRRAVRRLVRGADLSGGQARAPAGQDGAHRRRRRRGVRRLRSLPAFLGAGARGSSAAGGGRRGEVRGAMGSRVPWLSSAAHRGAAPAGVPGELPFRRGADPRRRRRSHLGRRRPRRGRGALRRPHRSGDGVLVSSPSRSLRLDRLRQLSAGRHPGQTGPHDDGELARRARAVPESSPGGVRGPTPPCAARPRAGEASICSAARRPAGSRPRC